MAIGRGNDWPIPRNVMIVAVTQTMRDFPGYCTDKWGEKEAAHCRDLCGAQYQFVETDWIRRAAIALRKSCVLPSINGGAKRKAKPEPRGKYLEYLRSPHWIRFRVSVLEFWECKCCLCKDRATEVHHNTYVRRGSEKLTDCVAICKACHKRVHSLLPDGNNIFDGDDSELF